MVRRARARAICGSSGSGSLSQLAGVQNFESFDVNLDVDIACCGFDVHLSTSKPSHTLQHEMSRCQRAARPIALCFRPAYSSQFSVPCASATTTRLFSNSASRRDVEPTTTSSSADAQATQDLLNADASKPPGATESDEALTAARRSELKAQWLDPNTTTLAWAEKKLQTKGINPIGSRRRRAAVRQTPNIPFEQLPYHAFQEARKILAEDRAEKLEQIKQAYRRLKTVEATPADTYKGGQGHKNIKVYSLRKHLEYLKIQADVNDPAVKRKFEDGLGKLTHEPVTLIYSQMY